MDGVPEQDVLTAILKVCAELFAAEDVAASDNFFMLGGTSLTAIELTEHLLDGYGFKLPLDAIFTEDTLGDLAGYCQQASSPEGTS
jgi:acyl carrier protein